MDYNKFIRLLRNVPLDSASEKRIWNNISHTLREKRSSVFLLANIWPRFLVSAAALAVVFVILFYNYEKQFEAGNFVQRINSTEYIYEICKYDGQWN